MSDLTGEGRKAEKKAKSRKKNGKKNGNGNGRKNNTNNNNNNKKAPPTKEEKALAAAWTTYDKFRSRDELFVEIAQMRSMEESIEAVLLSGGASAPLQEGDQEGEEEGGEVEPLTDLESRHLRIELEREQGRNNTRIVKLLGDYAPALSATKDAGGGGGGASSADLAAPTGAVEAEASTAYQYKCRNMDVNGNYVHTPGLAIDDSEASFVAMEGLRYLGVGMSSIDEMMSVGMGEGGGVRATRARSERFVRGGGGPVRGRVRGRK